jgi:hypothetical protein
MQWNKMTKRQQDAAREMRNKLGSEGVEATTSQIAKYFDEVMAYVRGDIDVQTLCTQTGWTAPAVPEPESEDTAAEDTGTALDTAVRTRVKADEALTAAMHTARQSGMTANEVARRVAPVHSRPTALAMLNATNLRTRVESALDSAGLRVGDDLLADEDDDVLLDEGPGRVLLVKLANPDGSSTAMNAASALTNLLRHAGFAAVIHDGDYRDPLEHMAHGGAMAIRPQETS